MTRELKPRASGVCYSALYNLVLAILLADQRSVLLEVNRAARVLVLDVTEADVEKKNNTKQLDHYSQQLGFYYWKILYKTTSTGKTDDLNGWLTLNELRCLNAGAIRCNYFTKFISATGISTTKRKVRRVVMRFWLCQTGKIHHFNRHHASQHKLIGGNALLFGSPKRVPDTLFWRSLGLRLLQELGSYVRRHQLDGHYNEIVTPVLLSKDFWLRSGHLANYGRNMLSTSGAVGYVIKPMNCIGHVCAYKQHLRAFRDLPLRFAEFGLCHRKESSGSIHGLLRTKGFTQDDAHVFCSRLQVKGEIETLHKAAINTYTTFGFACVVVKLSYPNNFSANWSLSVLRNVLMNCSVPFEEIPGDGAFYGAKIEYHLAGHSGNIWQCGTLQLDEVLPTNMNLTYIEQNGKRSRPVMVHRAMLGSFERFVGVLLEHHKGIPVWLAPIQVMLLSVGDIRGYKSLITRVLSRVRVQHREDSSNYNIGYRINKHSLRKIPYIILAGERERRTMTLSARVRTAGQHEVFTLESFIHLVRLKTHQFENEETI